MPSIGQETEEPTNAERRRDTGTKSLPEREDAVPLEQEARRKIDRQLGQCGWLVQAYRSMDLSAGPGVAVREFPLTTGLADYLLYVDRRVLGVIEAKPEGRTLTGVETQSAKYTRGLPANLPHYRLPLPFAYESTGAVTQFTNALDPHPRSREVFSFHRPEELRRLVGLEKQLRASLREMPPLDTDRLWRVQIEAKAKRDRKTSLFAGPLQPETGFIPAVAVP